MSSPLGPTLANVFLCYHENIWLQNCSSEFKPVIYRRYVDEHSYFFARNITSKNSETIYIVNIKTSNSLLRLKMKTPYRFLTSITRDNNKFMTSAYRKPTFSDVFTNFGSFFPKSYQYNLLFMCVCVCVCVCVCCVCVCLFPSTVKASPD